MSSPAYLLPQREIWAHLQPYEKNRCLRKLHSVLICSYTVASSFSPISSSVLGGGYGHPVRLAAATTLVCLLLWLLTQLIKKASRKLPPGPEGLPLIGDVRHAADHGRLSAPERKDEYGELDRCFQAKDTDTVGGEIMYVSALGQGILVLNSRRVAVDLLEKRSSIYSDRPHNIVMCDYMSEGLSLASTPYNDLYNLEPRVFPSSMC